MWTKTIFLLFSLITIVIIRIKAAPQSVPHVFVTSDDKSSTQNNYQKTSRNMQTYDPTRLSPQSAKRTTTKSKVQTQPIRKEPIDEHIDDDEREYELDQMSELTRVSSPRVDTSAPATSKSQPKLKKKKSTLKMLAGKFTGGSKRS